MNWVIQGGIWTKEKEAFPVHSKGIEPMKYIYISRPNTLPTVDLLGGRENRKKKKTWKELAATLGNKCNKVGTTGIPNNKPL